MNPIEGLLNVSMEKIKAMVDVNTIVGDPVTTADGTTVIPVSKVSFGFGAGGSEFAQDLKDNPEADGKMFGGGAGSGSWKTQETRNWMTRLGVKEYYVTKDGDQVIE